MISCRFASLNAIVTSHIYTRPTFFASDFKQFRSLIRLTLEIWSIRGMRKFLLVAVFFWGHGEISRAQDHWAGGRDGWNRGFRPWFRPRTTSAARPSPTPPPIISPPINVVLPVEIPEVPELSTRDEQVNLYSFNVSKSAVTAISPGDSHPQITSPRGDTLPPPTVAETLPLHSRQKRCFRNPFWVLGCPLPQ